MNPEDRLMCEVTSLAYDFRKKIGRLKMADGDCCDMSGCIAMFSAIDREVSRIETYSGVRKDTLYVRSGTVWSAYASEFG
jgi:hypothetical protein